MPKITQRNNSIKYCRADKCGLELIIGHNWSYSNQKQHNYICNFCQNKQKQDRRSKNKKNINNNKYCRIIECRAILILEENWPRYLYNKKDYICASCNLQNIKNYYYKNKEILLSTRKLNRRLDPEKFRQRERIYYDNNKEIINENAKRRYFLKKDLPEFKENKKRSRQIPENKIKKRNSDRKYKKKRILNDICFKLKENISKQINYGLKINKTRKNNKSCWNFLNFNPEQLKNHLESQFEYWMTWNNHGVYNVKTWDDNNPLTWTWQIDHIIPHSEFKYKSIEDYNFQQCWSLSNLRPYNAKKNVIEGAQKIRHRKKND